MKAYRSTKLDRQIAASRLSKDWDRWITLSDTDLFSLVRIHFPAVVEASRDQMLKFLTMVHVEDIIR
jgi:hypothetical protein